VFRTPVLIAAALALAFGAGFTFLAIRGCNGGEASSVSARPNGD
jgi:hypothetical protein